MDKVKIAFQCPESMLFEIGDMGKAPDQKLTNSELKILMKLMPNHNWIVIKWSAPIEQKDKNKT